jgi:hypothetical protein
MRPGLALLAIVLGPALIAGQATAQTLGQAPDDGVSLWRVAAALALCIALGVGAVFALRMRGGRVPPLPALLRRERRLQLIEVLRLNQHVDLCLVSCDDRTILLAASPHGVDVLTHADVLASGAPEDVA